MRPSEIYKSVIVRSLLANFSADGIDAIFQEGEILEIASGEKITRATPPRDFFMVLDGEIESRTRTASPGVGDRTRVGQSLELASLIGKRADWIHDWVAVKPSKVLRISWTRMQSFLNSDPVLMTALSRVALNVELQKLRRDMRIFCVPERAQLELIASLRTDSFESIFSDWGHKVFLVVSDGAIRVLALMDGRRLPIATFPAGDACLLDLNSSKIVIDADSNGSAWTISLSAIEKLQFKDELTHFLQMFDSSIFSSERDSAEKTLIRRDLKDQPISATAPLPEPVRLAGRTTQPSLFAELRKYFFGLTLAPQHDSSSSSAVCIATIAKHYGHPFSVTFVDRQLPRLKDENPLKGMQVGFRRIGFAAKIRKTNFAELVSFGFPVILQFNGRYVVFVEGDNRFVKIADPSVGRTIEVSTSDFRGNWSDEALLAAPLEGTVATKDARLPVYHYFAVFRGNYYSYFLIFLAGILGFLLSLALPVLQQFTFDRVLLARAEALIWPVIAGMFLLNVSSSILSWIESNLALRADASAQAFFTSVFMAKIVRLPISSFGRFRPGDLLARHDETREVKTAFEDLFLQNALRLVSVMACLAVLALYHPDLAIGAIIFVPIQLIGIIFVGAQVRNLNVRAALIEQRKKNLQLEHMDSWGTLQGSSGTLSARWRWEAEFVELNRTNYRLAIYDGIFGCIHFMCANATRLVLLFIGAQLYFRNEVSIGQIVATILLTSYIADPIWEILQCLYRIPQLQVHLSRLDSLFTLQTETSSEKAPAPTDADAAVTSPVVTFENVSFRYCPEPTPLALKRLSFTIQPGEIVAVVGASGSGKTTLTALINGAIEPTEGRILLGNSDTLTIPKSTLRKTVGVVDQEGALFTGSILENIAFGKTDPQIDAVLEAAKIADADEFVAKLPKAYSTNLGAEGCGLSEGQQQKIRIARTVFNAPEILVLDEATSHLDSISEDRVLRQIRRKFAGRTIIIITHRLNLASIADRVFVFEEGRLVEQGHHSKLIQQRGRYYELFCRRVNMN